MYQYLLFDLDGTLTNPKEGITKSVQYALHHFGIDVDDPDTLTSYIGPPLIPSFVEFHGLTQEQALEVLQVYRQRFASVGLFENEDSSQSHPPNLKLMSSGSWSILTSCSISMRLSAPAWMKSVPPKRMSSKRPCTGWEKLPETEMS